MTFTELIAEIKWEAELENDSTWDAHLLLLIWDEMVQIATLQDEVSLYINFFELSAADQDVDGFITLPPLIKLDRVEFTSNQIPVQTWLLPDRNQVVPPIPVAGGIRAYDICQGTPPLFRLYPIPVQNLNTDIITISYWKIPAVPVGGDTIFPVPWIQPLKTNCIRRALIFNSSTADVRAQVFSQILQKAEAVSQASNKSLDTTNDETKPS